MSQFGMDVERQADAVLLRLRGEFDISSKRDFETRSRQALRNRLQGLIVDLRSVSFIDSTGLGLILELWSRARRDGWEFAVVKAPDRVHQVFETAGLDGALPIIDAPPGEDRA